MTQSPCNSGTVANSTGTLSLPIAGQVWYVRNNEPAGGDGTSDAPFDTLAEAEAASGTGDTTFVFDGSNTTTNLDTGYAMESGERLIGESRPLSLDPDGGGPLPTSTLFPGTSGAQPTLTASNEDVIVLASNVLVDGVDVDPSGTGGGISGGAGTDAVTVQNVNVTDTGTAGTQPGIEMDSTTGVNRFTGVTVTNGGSSTAIGVRINFADRVLFANTATNTIATTGAKALDAASTSLLTSRWNDITVTGSGTGAIRLSSVTGQPVLGDGAGTDLSLQTTSGATAALDVASSNTVTVDLGRHRHDLGDRRAGDGHPQLQRLAVLLRFRQLDEQRGRWRQSRYEPDGPGRDRRGYDRRCGRDRVRRQRRRRRRRRRGL